MTKQHKKHSKEEKKPRRYVTPPAETMTPPSVHRHPVLPLVDIGSRKFEELCRDIMRQVYPDYRIALKRRSGQEQFGVDVEGFDDLQNPVTVVSAKCYKHIPAWEFRAWIEDFTKHLEGHWKGKGVKEFIIAVSVEANDDDMNDAARELAAQMRAQGIRFRLWDSVELSELLRKDPRLIDRYFNEAWVKALSADSDRGTPVSSSISFSVSGPTASQMAVFAQIEAAYQGPLDEALSRNLEEAIAKLRRGKRSAVKEWLADAQSDIVKWNGASAETRAKGLRAVAMVVLGEGDIETAERLLDEADAFAHPPDRVARAFFIRSRDDGRKALTYLTSPESRRERELVGALLIEEGEAQEALDVLAPLIGDDASSEVLRLRAVATLLNGGKRTEALNLVSSAVAKEPDSAMALFARGVVRMACALVDGASPQFGSVPNPIGRSLVLGTQEARHLLLQAADDFARLHETVEGDFKRDVEVWRLAALLLNDDTRDRGRQYGRALFARIDLEPAAVAWGLLHGLPLKHGKIKKAFADAIRNGKGTPSHVVVLAMMAAGQANADKGIAQIDKFAAHFPEASVFFDAWRQQLGADLDDDGSPSFAQSLRSSADTGDVASLYTYLSTHLSEVENLLAGAEFLASRGAFDLVDQLRPALSRIFSTRAIELATVAALNNDDARGAIEILDQAFAQGLDNTRRLSYLRIRAWKALGNHHALIDDIQKQLREGEDPELREELLEAYLRIGALDRVKEQAELALDNGIIDKRKAVQLAVALQSHAPDIARRALEGLGSFDVPADLENVVLELSSNLGIASLQQEMVRKLVADPEQKANFRSFDTVEELLAMLDEQAKGYRALLDQWLHGTIPAVAAMRNDGKDFVSLFLASKTARSHRAGSPLPMMLRSGTNRPEVTIPASDRPTLRLDLSGLLIAYRVGIVEELDEAFSIEVPESLPEALVLLEIQCHEVSKIIADGIKAVARGDSSVEIRKAIPTDVPTLSVVRGGVEGDDKHRIAFVLDRAFQAGHIDRAQLEDIRAQLEISDETIREPIAELGLGQDTITAFAQVGILEPLARTIRLVTEQGTVDHMLKQLELAEDEERIKSQLRILTQRVAGKLAASKWATIPSDKSVRQDERAGVLPAHARCLVETLPMDNATLDDFLWIEDRTVSRQPIKNLLTLPEILKFLRERGLLDKARYESIRTSLRQWGYLCLPIDMEELTTIVEAAPVVEGAIVENGPLGDLRRWFANELQHLPYVDQSHYVDQEGSITGEVRRTIDLSSLSSKLIKRLWLDGKGSDSDLNARSTWVWSNLRLTHLPAPLGASDPDARRSVAALNAAQMLMVPVHADLDRRKLKKERYAGLINWTINSVMGPLAKADAKTADLTAETVASMLSRLVEIPEGLEIDVAKALEMQMIRSARLFLDLLPDDWEERITSRSGLKQKLSIVMVMLLTIDDDVQISVKSLEETLRRCIAEGLTQCAMALHNSRKKAKLELSTDAEGLPAASLIIGRRRVQIHPSTMGLVHPDKTVRARLLQTIGEEGPVGRPITSAYLADLASNDDVEFRVDDFHERLRSDFRRSKQLLWERLSKTGSVQLADFDLPPPTHLLDYLGVSREFKGSAGELVAASIEALRQAVGIEQAIYRVSGIPYTLDSDLLLEFKAAVSEAGENPWAPRWESVNTSLVWLLASAAAGQPIERDEPGLDYGLSVSHAKLVVRLLRHGVRQAVNDPAWRALSPEIAFCLVWLHADQLARVVAGSGVDAQELGRWLSARARPMVFDFKHEEIWDDWLRQASIHLTGHLLLAKAASALLSAGVLIPEWLKATIGQTGEIHWTPLPEVLVATPHAPDPKFWISVDPVLAMKTAGWIGHDHPLQHRNQNELMASILEESKNAEASFLASLVLVIVDLDRVDDDMTSSLRERLQTTLEQSPLMSDRAFLAVTDALARVFARLGDQTGFESWLAELAENCARKWARSRIELSEENEASKAAVALFNAVYVFAAANRRPLTQICGLLAKDISSIVNAWPATLKAAINCLDGISQHVDIATAAEAIFPALLELRTR
ncbi:hypothetical protein [Agrobacterium pusense]|uniref:Uncharacterized protein n=1 Tax=Agrobacterium pusense TaxID=648995 RepID=A0AA44IXZ3_9HYPH|nr:hypothetical protein [Agrobacterium pusense]NRF07056.1 hypothetical protein [Agrobacterium pusense]NRF17920.1 hypothetical protein [Agrobacterium pusense]